jgi:hypothetical protein
MVALTVFSLTTERIETRIAMHNEHREHHYRMWSRAVLLKYWAMQLPSLAIVLVIVITVTQHFGWSSWVILAAVAAWIAKTAFFFRVARL